MVPLIVKIMSSFWGIVFYIRNNISLGLTTKKNTTHMRLQHDLFPNPTLTIWTLGLDSTTVGLPVDHFLGGPHHKAYSILGFIFGAPCFGKLPNLYRKSVPIIFRVSGLRGSRM